MRMWFLLKSTTSANTQPYKNTTNTATYLHILLFVLEVEEEPTLIDFLESTTLRQSGLSRIWKLGFEESEYLKIGKKDRFKKTRFETFVPNVSTINILSTKSGAYIRYIVVSSPSRIINLK